jgi:hypothetical protein
MEKPKIVKVMKHLSLVPRFTDKWSDKHDLESVAQAQRDHDVAYYEPIIRELQKIRDAQSALEAKLNDVELAIQQARQEVAREIWAWGEQPCVEHSEVAWPEELGGGTQQRQKMKRRRCQHCWQSLKSKWLEEKKA